MENLTLEFIKERNKFEYVKNEISISRDFPLIIKIIGAGVCGTDIDIARNKRNDAATVLGHEGIGQVIDINDSNIGFKINDMVVFNPVSPLNQKRILGHSYEGIFQRYRKISQQDINHSLIKKIPKMTPKWYGALLEPLSVAIYANEIVCKQMIRRNILILGTGAIAHVFAYYFNRKNYNVTIASRSLKRISSLREKNAINISYLHIDILKKLRPDFDLIVCCSSRSDAKDIFKLALDIATENVTTINLVNGFNEKIYVNIKGNSKYQKICINDIRRNNVCGKKHQIFSMSKPKRCFLTGHRGNALSHFLKAHNEINKNDKYYKKLIDKEINFQELSEFLNNNELPDISRRGKIFINMGDN